MKNLFILLVLVVSFIVFGCKKEDESEKFKLLTTPIWVSDSLLANGGDAAGPGGMLEKFKGDAKFNKDGTGTFGLYKGTWKFAYNETELVIDSDSLDFPITTQIVELTSASFKITTALPNPENLSQPIRIRLTFKPR